MESRFANMSLWTSGTPLSDSSGGSQCEGGGGRAGQKFAAQNISDQTQCYKIGVQKVNASCVAMPVYPELYFPDLLDAFPCFVEDA